MVLAVIKTKEPYRIFFPGNVLLDGLNDGFDGGLKGLCNFVPAKPRDKRTFPLRSDSPHR